MAKPFASLALKAVEMNKTVLPNLIRIQSGFMPEKNIDQAETLVLQLQEMLREMRMTLRAPISYKQSDDYVPLK
jgi:hypothetical protein